MVDEMTTKPESDREKVQATLLARFHRRGGPTAGTADFRSLTADRQQQVLTAATLAPEELPIILSWRDDHSWLLVTSHRVALKNGLAVESLKGSQIEKVGAAQDLATGRLALNGAPLVLTVTTSRGQDVALPVEPDKTAYGALRDLLTFIAASAQQKPAAAPVRRR